MNCNLDQPGGTKRGSSGRSPTHTRCRPKTGFHFREPGGPSRSTEEQGVRAGQEVEDATPAGSGGGRDAQEVEADATGRTWTRGTQIGRAHV